MNKQSNEDIIEAVEESRRQMHEMIDREYDNFLYNLKMGAENGSRENLCAERTLPLCVHPSLFKRQKPVSITFDDGHTVDVNTWKRAATVLLQACNCDPVMHQRLLDLREILAGRQRVILSASPEKMDVPLEIDEDLYLEGKFDAETMMYVLTNRVFRAIGFDYSGIEITVQNSHRTYASQETIELNEDMPEPPMAIQM